MDPLKKKKLEMAGYHSVSVAEYLSLSPEDEAVIEMKLALSKLFRELRTSRNLTQEQAAKLVGTGQARIAKIETGDRSVGFDLIMRGLIRIGAPPLEIGKAIERSQPRSTRHSKPTAAERAPTA